MNRSFIFLTEDDANNKSIVNFRYRINYNIFPSFTQISYAIDSTSVPFTIYNNGDLIELDEFKACLKLELSLISIIIISVATKFACLILIAQLIKL